MKPVGNILKALDPLYDKLICLYQDQYTTKEIVIGLMDLTGYRRKTCEELLKELEYMGLIKPVNQLGTAYKITEKWNKNRKRR